MKDTKKVKSIEYIIIALIIIVGGIVCLVKGFNIELFYEQRQAVVISNNTGLDKNKVEEIVKSVLDNRKVQVKEVERFGNCLEIQASSISEDEKKTIIQKINDEIEDDISEDDTEITTIANTRIRDILKPYILPGVVSFIIIIAYFTIVYHKMGLVKVLTKSVLVPVITELVYYALIAITRIPFGRIVNAIGLGVYVVTIGVLTLCFEKEKEKLTKGEE